VEWWAYAILVILFLGLWGQGEKGDSSRLETPTPSQPGAGSKRGAQEPKAASRFGLGLRWKRNPGNVWERERQRHHPVDSRLD
jgi:hypothetical protein